MKFVLALHVGTAGNRNVTFGIDRQGRTWLAVDTGNPQAEPAYFEFDNGTFAGVPAALADFTERADRYRNARDQAEPEPADDNHQDHGADRENA